MTSVTYICLQKGLFMKEFDHFVTAQDPDHDAGLILTNTLKPTGATFIDSNFTWTVGAAFAGTTNFVEFVADDGAGAPNSVVTNITWIFVLFDANGNGVSDGWEWSNFTNLTTSMSIDSDGDGMKNYDEYFAGTQPTNENSFFWVMNCATPVGQSNHQVTVKTEAGRKYTIYFADGRYSNNPAWTPFINSSTGTWIETRGSTNYTFTDNEGADTSGSAPASGVRHYRVRVEVP